MSDQALASSEVPQEPSRPSEPSDAAAELAVLTVLTVGQRIERVIADMNALYETTKQPYFQAQAGRWSGWVWMLKEDVRKKWAFDNSGFRKA
jgi:hypothetical protein